MDFSKFKTHDWLVIGGGLGMLIFGLLDWWKVDTGFGSFSGGNAFDFFFTGTVPWILLVAAAVITFLRIQGTIGDNIPWPMIIVFATALSAVLLLIRALFNPGGGNGIDVTFAMWLSLVSGVAATAGAVMAFQAGGGSISDLADVDKLKSAFDSGDEAGDAGDASAPETPDA